MAACHRVAPLRTALLAAASVGVAVLVAAMAPAAALSSPRFGRSVDATRVGGRIWVVVHGHRSRLLNTRTLAVGSTVDATRGQIALAGAVPAGALATADVTGGRFRITQPRSAGGQIRLSLASSSCPQASAATIYVPDMKVRVPSHHHRRHVRSAASGVSVFESIGRYQTAANAGAATWETADGCADTTVSQDAGTVSTATRGPANRPLPGSASADGDAATSVSGLRAAGVVKKVWTVACSDRGQPPAIGGYCEALLAEEMADGFVGYAPGLFGKSASGTFDLCLDQPGGSSCQTWPFSAPESHGSRDGLVACTAPSPGRYSFRWSVAGVPLTVRLPSYTASRGSAFNSPCSGRLGAPSSPVGSLHEPLPPNAQTVNAYALPGDGALTSMSVYVEPTNTKGQESIQGVVYADADGAPGALVGTTNRLPLGWGDGEGFRDLEFSPALAVTAGTYWFGVVTQGSPNVLFARFEPADVLASAPSVFPGIPNNPFGPLVTKQRRMTLYVDYDTA